MKPIHEPKREDLSLAGVLGALSDPVRIQIVHALAADGEVACGTLPLDISKATRSHHLRVLREAGLTHTRPVGTERRVSLRREDLDARFPGLLDAVLAAGRERPAVPASISA